MKSQIYKRARSDAPASLLQHLPPTFCWTKMGTEAGQPLAVILARKEAERQLGEGVFFWGIGNALGMKIWDFVDKVPTPPVVFTGIKSKAKAIDASPSRVVAWTAYYDRCGSKHLIPPFAFVTSRADPTARINQSRFALVCRSKNSLGDEIGLEPVFSERLVNYQSNTAVAPSQVTAVVEMSSRIRAGRTYDVAFAAELVPPYYVKLCDPVEVPLAALAEINQIPLSPGFDAARWRNYLDQRFPFRTIPPIQMGCSMFEPQAIVVAVPHQKGFGEQAYCG